MGEHVLEPQPAGALQGAPLAERDQLGQPPVRRPVGRKAQQGIAVRAIARPFPGDARRQSASTTIVAAFIFPRFTLLITPVLHGARPVDSGGYGLTRRRVLGRPSRWSGRARACPWENRGP